MATLRMIFSDLEGHFCNLKLVSIHLGGSCPWLCAGEVIHNVIIHIGGNQRWLITVTIQLTSTRLVVRKSVDDMHSIACCDIVVPSAMMHVQNYARSRINVAVAESAPQANVQSVCIICTTVGQYFNDTQHCIGLSTDRQTDGQRAIAIAYRRIAVA